MAWNSDHLVSLAGVYKPKENIEETALPLALKQYITDHPEIKRICLRMDKDATGRLAANTLKALLQDRYEVSVYPPPIGKDYNDCLCYRLGLPITSVKPKAKER